MTVQLSHDFFSARIDAQFRVLGPVAAVLTLASVEKLNGATAEHPGFSLIFRGPVSPALVQQIHTLEDAGAQAFDIFLVPVARAADGMRYEAIFN
jgi:hypothetical protein